MKNMKLRVILKNYSAGFSVLIDRIIKSLGFFSIAYIIVRTLLNNNAVKQAVSSIPNSGIIVSALSSIWLYAALAVLIPVIRQLSFSKYTTHVLGDHRKGSISVSISINDIFKNSGEIVIPCNTYFATDLNVIGTRSIQAQMTKRMTLKKKKIPIEKAEEIIGSKVADCLNSEKYAELILPFDNVRQANKEYKTYKFGTIVPLDLEVDKMERRVHLLAMSTINEGTATVDFDTLIRSIDGMWQYISDNGIKGTTLVVPIMGTGNAGLVDRPKQTIARYIVKSFVENSNTLGINNLILSIYPGDYLKKDDIDILELYRYCDFVCSYPDSDFS